MWRALRLFGLLQAFLFLKTNIVFLSFCRVRQNPIGIIDFSDVLGGPLGEVRMVFFDKLHIAMFDLLKRGGWIDLENRVVGLGVSFPGKQVPCSVLQSADS